MVTLREEREFLQRRREEVERLACLELDAGVDGALRVLERDDAAAGRDDDRLDRLRESLVEQADGEHLADAREDLEARVEVQDVRAIEVRIAEDLARPEEVAEHERRELAQLRPRHGARRREAQVRFTGQLVDEVRGGKEVGAVEARLDALGVGREGVERLDRLARDLDALTDHEAKSRREAHVGHHVARVHVVLRGIGVGGARPLLELDRLADVVVREELVGRRAEERGVGARHLQEAKAPRVEATATQCDHAAHLHLGGVLALGERLRPVEAARSASSRPARRRSAVRSACSRDTRSLDSQRRRTPSRAGSGR